MSLYLFFKWPLIELACSRQRNVHILVSKYEIEREARDKEQKRRHKAQKKEVENRMKQMRKRWPNIHISSDTRNLAYCGRPQAVNSAGRIYWNNSLSKECKDKQDEHEPSYVKVASVDIDPNDHILYTLESLHDTRGEYLRLKVCDLKNKSLRIITKGLPPTKRVTSWAMRVLDSMIVLCNEFGEVFVLTCSDTRVQLNLDCSFSLPFPSSSPSRDISSFLMLKPNMCVTNKREVIIARYYDKEVYICPITEEGQMEGIIPVAVEEHETKCEVRGVAFDATHEEEIIVLRSNRNLDSKYQIEVYSRNGDQRNFYPLPGNWSVVSGYCCLLSNPNGIVAVVQNISRKIRFWHLVGKVFVQP